MSLEMGKIKTEGQGEVQEFVDIVGYLSCPSYQASRPLIYEILHILSVIMVSVYRE